MVTPRKPTRPTVEAADQFCAQFDDLFSRRAAREALRQYLLAAELTPANVADNTVAPRLLAGLLPVCAVSWAIFTTTRRTCVQCPANMVTAW